MRISYFLFLIVILPFEISSYDDDYYVVQRFCQTDPVIVSKHIYKDGTCHNNYKYGCIAGQPIVQKCLNSACNELEVCDDVLTNYCYDYDSTFYYSCIPRENISMEPENDECYVTLEDIDVKLIFKPNLCVKMNELGGLYGIYFTDGEYLRFQKCTDSSCEICENVPEYSYDANVQCQEGVELEKNEYLIKRNIVDGNIISEMMVHKGICHERIIETCFNIPSGFIVRTFSFNNDECSDFQDIRFRFIKSHNTYEEVCSNSIDHEIPVTDKALIVYSYKSLEDCLSDSEDVPSLYNLQVEDFIEDNMDNLYFFYFKKNINDIFTLCTYDGVNKCYIVDDNITIGTCKSTESYGLKFIKVMQYQYVRETPMKGDEDDKIYYSYFKLNDDCIDDYFYEASCSIYGNPKIEMCIGTPMIYSIDIKQYKCVYDIPPLNEKYCSFDLTEQETIVFKPNRCLRDGQSFITDGNRLFIESCDENECTNCPNPISLEDKPIECKGLELIPYSYITISSKGIPDNMESFITPNLCVNNEMRTCYKNRIFKMRQCDDPSSYHLTSTDRLNSNQYNFICTDDLISSFSNSLKFHEYSSEDDCKNDENNLITYQNLNVDACKENDIDTHFSSFKYVNTSHFSVYNYVSCSMTDFLYNNIRDTSCSPGCDCCFETTVGKFGECLNINDDLLHGPMGLIGTYFKVFSSLPPIYNNVTCTDNIEDCSLDENQELYIIGQNQIDFNLTISKGSLIVVPVGLNNTLVITEDGEVNIKGGTIKIKIDNDDEYKEILNIIKSNGSYEMIIISGKYEGKFDDIILELNGGINTTCEKIVSKQKENEDKTLLAISFTIDSSSCKGFNKWIIVGICIGVVILVTAVLIVIFKSKTIRNKVLPFRKRGKIKNESSLDLTQKNELYKTKVKVNPIHE